MRSVTDRRSRNDIGHKVENGLLGGIRRDQQNGHELKKSHREENIQNLQSSAFFIDPRNVPFRLSLLPFFRLQHYSTELDALQERRVTSSQIQ